MRSEPEWSVDDDGRPLAPIDAGAIKRLGRETEGFKHSYRLDQASATAC